jgi:molybdopterin synthase catalytic subunit
MIKISEEPIILERLLAIVADAAHGAQTLFLGVVRNSHEGRTVSAVTYEAFKPLARKVLLEIAREAEVKWKAHMAIAHRLGHIQVGETSLAIAASSPHRAEAFAACRYAVEEIKRRLPIWKKEYYEGGKSRWLDGCSLEIIS